MSEPTPSGNADAEGTDSAGAGGVIADRREPLAAPQILWTIIVVGGALSFVSGVILMIKGEFFSWLRFACALLTARAARPFVSGRRDLGRRSALPAARKQCEELRPSAAYT